MIPSLAPSARIQEIAARRPGALVVALPGADHTGAPDHLGTAFARHIHAQTGLPLAEGLTMLPAKAPLRPGTTALERILHRPRFQGTIIPGAEYVVAAGRLDPITYSAFRHYIERHHGHVVETHELAGDPEAPVAITPKTKHQLITQLGVQDGINPKLRAYGINGGVIGSLTEAEGQALGSYRSPKELEDAILSLARRSVIERELLTRGPDWQPTWKEVREEANALGWDPLTEHDKPLLEEARAQRVRQKASNSVQSHPFRRAMPDSQGAPATVQHPDSSQGNAPPDRQDHNVALTFGKAHYGEQEIDLGRMSASGDNPYGDKLPDKLMFETITVGHLRNKDSEPYILEVLAALLLLRSNNQPKLVHGEMTLISEMDFCESCQGVISMFQELFPNLKITLRASTPKQLPP